MAGLDLSKKIGTKTKKGTTITQSHASAVSSDNAYIRVVQDNSHLVAQMLPTAIGRALEKIGILAEGHVIGYMTREHIVDTGRLRNSITHAVTNDAGDVNAIVGTNVRYARYVHNGTSRVTARPFLTAPIGAHGDEYRELLKKELSS